MSDSSTLVVTNGSSINGNTAANVSSPASLSVLSSWLIRRGTIGALSLRKRDFMMLEFSGDAAVACVLVRRTEEASP